MNGALSQLVQALPPPAGISGCDVNWLDAENKLKLTFPKHFKDFLSVYGDSVWFDLYHILYPATSGPIDPYLQSVQDQLNILVEYGMTDEDFNSIRMPLYPEIGGLFPFMASSDGDYYFWKTDLGDPDQWPMMRWEMDTLRTLKFATIAELFLDTLEWMKVNQPHRAWVMPRIET